MIYEHEIPVGSKLYFGKSAKIKREIENKSSEVFLQNGFSEICTPVFSYHQHQSVAQKSLIRFSDRDNHSIALRADSTVDVVRLITKRVSKSENHNHWYYIQPTYEYPSIEHNQIGAELIYEEDLSKALNIATKIFDKLGICPTLHLANINIPKKICEHLGVDIEIFRSSKLEKILALGQPWLQKLAYLQKPKDIDEVIAIAPKDIQIELEKLSLFAKKITYPNLLISPLYYAKMRYYDGLIFRFIQDNETFGIGGEYEIEDNNAVGFGIYSDKIIEELMKENK
jgi:histidyl-tRNA synthetase